MIKLLVAFALTLGAVRHVSAQAQSTKHIPIQKQKPPPVVLKPDTVRIFHTDTLRLTVYRVDTLRLIRVDTLVDSTCTRSYVPIVFPIPIGRGGGDDGFTVTPEPGTFWLSLAGMGTVAFYLAYTKKK
jgi:hypothetical protein